MLLAVVAGLSYSAFHPFAADGSGGSYTSSVVYGHRGLSEEDDVGLSASRVAFEVESATITGPGAAHVRVSSPALSVNGTDGTIATGSTRLPYHVPAGNQLWISANVKLTSCGFVKLNRLKLRYTILGITTSETVPLQQPLTLRCR